MASEGITLGNAYIQILPSTRGLSANINGLMEDEGATAGNTLGNSIASAASSTLANSLSSLGGAFSTIGSTLSAYVTAPIIAAGTGSVVAASNFEDAFAMLSTIADPEALPFEELNDQIMELSNTTGLGAAEIAEAAYGAISAGQDTADAVGFVAQASQLARGGFTSVATATDVLTTALNAYGLSSEEAAHVSDVLIQTQNFGKTTVDQLAASMGRVIPTAAAANVGIEDLASQYVALTRNGIATAEATTYINSMLNELSRNGTNASDAFREAAGVSFPEFIAAGGSTAEAMVLLSESCAEAGLSVADAFGSAEAGKAANVLVQHTSDATEALVSMQTTGGQTAAAFAIMSDTSSVKMEQLKTSITNLGIAIGEDLLPIILPIADRLIELLDSLKEKWDSLSPEAQNTIIQAAAIAAAIGPVLLAAGTVLSTTGKLIGAVQTIGSVLPGLGSHLANVGSNAANAAAGATSATASFSSMAGTALMLVALGAAVWLVAQGMSVMADAAIRLANAGPAAIATFFGMVGAATAMSAVILLVGASASASAVGLLALGAAVLMIAGGIALLTEACAHLVSEITGLVQTIINGSNQINSIIRQLAASVRSIIREVATAIVAIIRTIAVSINSVVSNVAGNIQSTVRTVASAIQSIARSIQTTVQSIARSIQTTIQTAANSVGRIVDSIGGSISRVLNSVAGVVTSVGNAAMQTGRGFDTFTAALSRLVGMNLLDIAATMTAVSRGLDSIVSSARGIPSVTQSIRELSAAFANAQLRFNPGNLTLPHFSMSGSFNAQRGTVPQVRVQWYAKAAEQGALFSSPQLIGVGDSAQGELLYGHDSLMRDIRSAVSEGQSSDKRPIVVNVYGHESQNVNDLADAVIRKVQHSIDQKGYVFA